VGLVTMMAAGCEAPAPAPVVTATVTVPTAVPTRPLAVAVAVGSPTPTPALVGDYVTLARPRLQVVRQDFDRLEAQLAAAKKAPIRMAEDDWRNQTNGILEDLLTASGDLRSLGTRVAVPARFSTTVVKVLDDVDFVANEYHMAFDFDPDSTHFLRAGRAERTTVTEVDSLLDDLKR
jgi:hypothetical protein